MPTAEWEDPLMRRETVIRVVDNRVMVLGLDYLYRESMKQVEASTFLGCARALAKRLEVRPADVPVEGYYVESSALREYFQLMRALQGRPEEDEERVKKQKEFKQLWELTTSGLYGRPERDNKLFPKGWDPLADALAQTTWQLPLLLEAAYRIATDANDWSLVGMAARTEDAVVVTATRESTVLYAPLAVLGLAPKYRYEWQAEEDLTEAANRFIETANRYLRSPLPQARPENAEVYYQAFEDNGVLGRCVRIGKNEDGTQHYHWAIESLEGLDHVEEFWSTEIWTTTRYRAERLELN